MMSKKQFPLRPVPFILILSAVACIVSTPRLCVAQSDEEKGRAIAEETDRRDLGWGTSKNDFRMILHNRHGQTSTRELSSQILEVTEPGLGNKSLIVFSSPRDVNGTAFLSHTKVVEPDDQWLYLPALKRVKRISSSNKSGSFLGSEFAFEDLSSQEVDKYEYKWLRDELLGDVQCFVVERYPQYEKSGYTRQIQWTDETEYRPMKIDFYDRKDSLLKTLVFEDYRLYEDKYWRALSMTMTNHQTGKSTELTTDDYQFGLDFEENMFTPSRLRLAR